MGRTTYGIAAFLASLAVVFVPPKLASMFAVIWTLRRG